jgi:imidazoleglycerol-phosphate dehydratase
MTTITRTTKETTVSVSISVEIGDPSPSVSISTSDPFFDHMIATLARYAGLGLAITASGDLDHHLTEDVALTLGRALREVTPETCARYGTATVPMDDALVTASIDLGGRFFWGGALEDLTYDHVLRSFADTAGATLHVVVQRGRDPHHVIEAAFKAVGLALRQALSDSGQVFSTKGTVRWEIT